ncbi:MAG: DUF4347 domain-containing protein, partial [Moraxellaceae bacterium]|nr:DUF4347 domain-containing protein [Moraxellaceae bacterium]
MGHADLRARFRKGLDRLTASLGLTQATTASTAAPTVSGTGTEPPRRLVFEEVEARLLYSADLAPGVVDSGAEVRSIDDDSDDMAGQANPQPEHSTQQARTLVFIDDSVADQDVLVRGILAEHPDAEIIHLDSSRDGVAQISEALAGRQDIDAIHLLTHGSEGRLQIGATRLDGSTLGQHADAITGWRAVLSEDADLLIYGCDFAGSDAGRALADGLASLSGADVAASDDLTGNASQGGDWELEYRSGSIQSALAVGTATQESWSGTLAVTVGSTTSAATSTSGATSLSWSHTVAAGSDRMLVVSIAARNDGPVDTVTYGGQALTRLSSVIGDGVVVAEIWYLLNPTVGSANVVISLGSTHEFVAGATNFTGVDQTTPFGTVKTDADDGSTNSSASVSSAAGDVVIDVIALRQQDGTPSIGGGQSLLWTERVGNSSADPTGASSYEIASGSSTSMTWSSIDNNSAHAAIGVAIKATANTAPTVTITPTSYAATEQVAINLHGSGITVADAQGGSLTVTISSGSANSEFTASVGSTGVTISSGNGTNSLVLTGTIAQLNNLFAGNNSGTLTFRQAGDTPPASVTMTISASDGSLNGNDTATINITSVNDAPDIVTTGGNLSYSENAGAVVIDSGLTVTDADNTNLTGATVRITSNYQNGQDVLAFTNQLGITGSWDAATGTLTLTGTTTVANYQTALRTVTYQNTSESPSSSNRVVTFTVNDGNTTDAATRGIAVSAVNDPPDITTTGTTLSYTENAAATAIDSGLTVTDVDNSNLTGATVQITGSYQNGQDILAFTNQLGITGSWNAATGTLTLSGTASVANYQTALRSVTYQNSSENPNTSTRTVTFTVSDNSASDSATRNISVTTVNDPPVITSNGGGASASVNVAENSSAVTTVTATDAEGSGLTYSINGGADAGRFTINSSTGALTFSSAPNYESPNDSDGNNTYVVTVQVSDGSTTDTQTITVTVTDVDEFDVSAVTDSNAAANTVAENASNGTTVGITATASDADGSNNTVTYSLSDNAGGRFTINSSTGVVTVANGTLLNRESA